MAELAMRVTVAAWSLSCLFSCSVRANAQPNGSDACVLASVKNGDVTTVRGKIRNTAHDMVLDISGCKPVVVVYPGTADAPSSSFDPSLLRKLARNSNFKRFKKYVSAEYAHLPNGGACNGCPKYEVEATLTGSLEIASVPKGLTKDPSGFLRDASGKVVGNAGFGHPGPIYDYLMVIESVSDVVARKLPRPSSARVYSDLPAGPLRVISTQGIRSN